MEQDKAKQQYMLRALELAKKGAGRVSPNPMVGAVIVKNDEVIGEGYHHAFGQAHAEVDALECCNRLGNSPHGAAMYVTLEPCCHHGKTPPCTDAIIAAGITAVEVAAIDEFEQVSGKGVEILKQNGIEVNIGLCGEQARELNVGFFKYCREKKPYVILKWAQSIDGKLTFRDGDSRRWFTGDLARHHVHELRDFCDGIMVGSQTVRDDDPTLNVRIFGVENTTLKRFVLDSNLSLPLARKLFQTPEAGPSYVFTTPEALQNYTSHADQLKAAGCQLLTVNAVSGSSHNLPADRQSTSADRQGTSADRQSTSADRQGTSADRQSTSADRQSTSADRQSTSADRQSTSASRQSTSADRQSTSAGRLDLAAVLDEVAALGVCNLMVEGGPTLLNEFLVQKLADKVVVYTAPIVVGDGPGVVPINFGESFELENVKNEIIENDIVMSGTIIK